MNGIIITKVFEDYDIEIIKQQNGKPLFELYSVGMALGYTKTDGKTIETLSDQNGQIKYKLFPRKDRIDKIVRNADIQLIEYENKKYMDEEQLYDFMLESKTRNCREFKKWITHTVLPSINEDGCYISAEAEPPRIIYRALYQPTRVYDTFKNTNDIFSEYDKFCEITEMTRKNRNINNDERIESSYIIINVIHEIKRKEILTPTLESWELEKLNCLESRIHLDIDKLRIKQQGGKKSTITRKLNKTSKELAIAKDKIQFLEEQLTPPEMYHLPICPFSENYQYKPSEPGLSKYDRVKTSAYIKWIGDFHKLKELPTLEELNIDTEKPIKLHMAFACPESWDVTNCHKSLIDQLSRHYNFNDNIIECYECYGKTTVEDKKEGCIWFTLHNF